MKITRLLILLIALALIAACGNKGDLIRPGAPASGQSAAPASAESTAPASATSAAPASATSDAPASAQS